MIKLTTKNISLIIIFLLSCFYGNVLAAPAYPGIIQFVQPDGTVIPIRLIGDEYFHYVTTEDGCVITQDKEGYYTYATIDENNVIIPTSKRVSAEKLKSSSNDLLKADSPEFKPVLQQGSNRVITERILRNEELSYSAKDESIRSSNQATAKTGKGLIILANFQDVKFTVSNANQAFSNLLNATNYSTNGATGSARDYYMDNSLGEYVPQFDVVGPIELPGTCAFYGADVNGVIDSNVKQMIIDACNVANTQYSSLNFKDYDQDNDGIVDLVYVFYAGHNQAESGVANEVWPHQSSVKSKNITIDGVLLGNYACSSEYRGSTSSTEMATIGTFCHEFGHTFGLPDLYDVDFEENGEGNHPGNWSIMATGLYLNNGKTPPYFNGLERVRLDWGDKSETLTAGTKFDNLTLSNISSGKSYMIKTSTDGEYYWLENRQINSKWDASLPAHGMLVYHIDLTKNKVFNFTYGSNSYKNWSAYDLYSNGIPNIIGNHQCVDLLRANNETMKKGSDLYFYYNDYPGHPFPGTTAKITISDTTTPSLKLWNGNSSGIVISNIAENNGTITFSFAPSTSAIKQINNAQPVVYISNKQLIANNISENTQLEIYDITGQLCRIFEINSDCSLDLNLSGIYIVKVKSANKTLSYKISL